MSETKIIGYSLKGMVSEMDDQTKSKIGLLQEAIKETVRGTGDEGKIAFTIVACDLEDDETLFEAEE